jgi:hypothetical protein
MALTLRIVDPENPDGQLPPASYDVDGDSPIKFDADGMRIENPDGSVTFDTSGVKARDEDVDENDFYRNLADEISEGDLSTMASNLIEGIAMDDQSRKDWLDTRAVGLRLLAFKIEEPRGDLGTSSAPLEGMSTFRHPALGEATVRFQATARGELLPASGPVKVRNDQPMRPDAPQNPFNPMMGNNGGPPMPGEGGDQMDDLAAALEKDFNHYLTVTATEYIPDTDRMLFYIGFGGDGFKKVYNCPLRKRPVSESVDAEDLIVSNRATDLRNCSRVTHRIKMQRSWLRRMQIDGYYRDFKLALPAPPHLDAVEKEKASIGGYAPQPAQPRDADHDIYECYCELDLDEFAPKKFRGKELPLPYVVTLDKDSRQVLAVRRNWNEDDEQALAKQFFVQFPFIRGLGFYGLGLIHLMGNIVVALTAMYREMIDAGMFNNFPGFLYAQGAGRQKTNQLRVPPGGGFPVDVPPGMKIQDAFMPLPYKEPGASFVNLVLHLEEVAQRIGQTADVNIGEGKQDVPVGTTMALIEQATKIMDSVHKRLHAAQAEEFGLLKERFRENPEAFWRHNKKPARQWTVEQFQQALEERELVPVADPNNPTSLHRIAKATIIDTLVTKYPLDIDRRSALKRMLRIAGIEADGLINAQPQQPPPDPRMEAIKSKAQAEQMKAQIDQAKVQIQAQTAQMDFTDKEKERAFKQQMQQYELQLEQMRVQAEMIIHAHDLQRDTAQAHQDMQIKQATAAHDIMAQHVEGQASLQQDAQKHQLDIVANAQKQHQEIAAQRDKHQQQLAAERERHAQQIELEREKHKATLENQKQMAEAKAKAVGPAEEKRVAMEGEKHQQQMQIDQEKHDMAGEKHKADLANQKKLAEAKAKAAAKPKPAGDKK